MPLIGPAQNDFGGGAQLNVAAHLIDDRSFYTAINGLLDDDGSMYRRGGSQKKSKAAFGGAGRFVWTGHLLGGRRTVVASTTAYGVFEADDETVLSLGGSGLTRPVPAVAFRDLLFIGGGVIYGGSRKSADYSASTVEVTKGSKVVKGAASVWTGNVDVGMLFRIAGERVYVVANVKSNTELELSEAYEGASGAGKNYTLKRLEAATSPYLTSSLYAVSGRRLIAIEGERTVWFSEPDKPHLYKATIFPQETIVENKHELEEGIKILCIQSIGVDKILVGHTGGFTAFSNMAKSIVDGLGNSQHRIDVLSRDIVPWGNGSGIAGWRGTLVVPGIENVYLIDGVSTPVPIADSIMPRYRERVREGLVPGGAWEEREHYFLPLLNSAGTPEDLLIVRLDKAYQSRNKTLYPWSFGEGSGARVAAGALRPPEAAGEPPVTFAAAKDGWILNLASYFDPSEFVKNDHDGTTHLWSMTTRDYGIGEEAIARWRKLQLFYELWASEGNVPIITAEVGIGVRRSGLPAWDEVTWDDFEWASTEESEFELLEEGAPENAGDASELIQNEYVWFFRRKARYIRVRLSSADPAARLVLRGLQISAAQPGGRRRSRVA